MVHVSRVLGWLVVIGIGVALAAVATWRAAQTVDVGTVERGPMRVTVDEEGETRLRNRFVVSAPVTGRMLRIELEPGDSVRRGATVIARLLPATPAPLDAPTRQEAQARVAAAEAALQRADADRHRAEATLDLARSELARERQLFESQLTSRQQLDTREAAVNTAQAALAGAASAVVAAQHEREMASARLVTVSPPGTEAPELVIRSPINGVLVKRYRDSEALVPAGEPLVEVGDPREIEIVADLLSVEAVKVAPGQPVLIDQWGGDQPLEGRVRRLEPAGFMKISALGVEEQRVNVIIDVDKHAAAAKALGAGYRVEVRIIVWEATDVVKAPISSLVRHRETWSVFVVDGDRVRSREVRIGRRNSTEAEVVAGLEPGERVIVHPTDAVGDGVRINPRDL